MARWAGNAVRLLVAGLLGCVLSLVLYQVWELDRRWAVVVVIGITGVAIAMCLVRVFSGFLLVASLFCLPIASFVKFIWPSGYSVAENVVVAYSGLNNIGVIDFVIAGLYLSWFYRFFVLHEKPRSQPFNWLDGFVVWFILANVVAMIGSVDFRLGLGATTYYLKYALLYFYLSRHFEERHLPWLLAAFGFSIGVESLLGAYQFATGHLVGLAVDKGMGNSQTLDTVEAVPGQGSYHRASGTLTEPHALGQFLEMLLPFCGVLFLTPRLRRGWRALALIAAGAAAVTIVFSLSRGAYIGVGGSLAVGVVLILVLWGERQVVPALAALVLLGALIAPFTAHLLYERLTRSLVTLDARVPVYWVAVHVFADYPLFGIGPGNWIYIYPGYDQDWLVLDWYSNLIHNDILLTSVEVGIFGVVPYLCIIVSASWRLFSLARGRRDLVGRCAMAALLGMIASEITNQADPGLHEPTVNLLFWIFVALSVALPRLRPDAGGSLMLPSRPVGWRGGGMVPGLGAAGLGAAE